MNGATNLRGFVNPANADATPFVWGDTALANEFGTSASAMGHDPAQASTDAMQTSPETSQNPLSMSYQLDLIKKWAQEGGIPLFGPWGPPTKIGALASKESSSGASAATDTRTFYEKHKNLILSAVLVVLALIMFSKGFSRLGEEGVQIIEKVGKAT